MITTVIFDLDGLLADTEKLHRRAYQDILPEFGLGVTDAQYDDHWVRRGKGIVEYLAERHSTVDPAAIRPRKSARYKALVESSVQPMPGALACLEALHPHKTLALATASYRESALPVLDTLGIHHYFAAIATKLDAKRPKPAPDIFLGVAETLAVPPHECVVIEDAEKGILAAAAAGMPSIAIPTPQTRDNDFSRAALLLPSLHALTLQVLDQLA